MKICFFTKHEISWGSSRERVGVYLDFLKERGHRFKVIYCIPNTLSKIWIGGPGINPLFEKLYCVWHSRIFKYIKILYVIAIAAKFDIIFIQKVDMPYFLLKALKKANDNIIFDFDDNCFWPSNFLSKKGVSFFDKLSLWKKALQDPKILKFCSKVIAGNSYLADIVGRNIKSGRQHTVIIPTSIDCKCYFPQDKRENGEGIVIGWAGSGENHLRHLRLITEPLEELAKKYNNITFKLIGTMGSSKIEEMFGFLGPKFISIDWLNPDKLPAAIQSFDIGLMPLVDDEESRGKCGFKILQYMACGVVPVGSCVGVNQEIIEDGVNGFLVNDKSGWIAKLSFLLDDSNLRDRLAKHARSTVVQKYSLDKASEKFIEVIEGLNK